MRAAPTHLCERKQMVGGPLQSMKIDNFSHWSYMLTQNDGGFLTAVYFFNYKPID
jgi:hypothetical protein